MQNVFFSVAKISKLRTSDWAITEREVAEKKERAHIQRFEESVSRIIPPDAITIDPHFSPQFYAELWGVSPSTVLRWFQDLQGVLNVGQPARNGKRTRIELRIPYSLAMRVYRERTRSGVE